MENKIFGDNTDLPTQSWSRWKIALMITAIALVFASLVFGLIYGYVKYYQARVYPGVYVGDFHLGGMSANELKSFAETLNNRLSKEGVEFSVSNDKVKNKNFKLDTILVEGDSTIELISLDSDRFAQLALAVGRDHSRWYDRPLDPFLIRFFGKHLLVPINVSNDKLKEVLADQFSALEDSPHNAGVKITNLNTGAYEIVLEKSGQMFDWAAVLNQISSQLSQLSFVPIVIETKEFLPTIKSNELNDQQMILASILSYDGLGINYIDPQTKWRKDWSITIQQLSTWIEPSRDADGKIIFTLNADKVKEYLTKEVSTYIDKPAVDAKFSMTDGRVKEFVASQSGQKLDLDQTYNDLNNAFKERNYHPLEAVKTITAAAVVVEPNIKLSGINDQGISDILGVGISTFKDSHSNRIKNITNAVKRLNGIIIKPGEEFSSLKYAGPFTSENGFLPEEVIKGDKLKLEIGGGMCQIGTTLFRMAMNSGMPITERHNHSLVVQYYADPVNHNPGTDASLYEPILDFKFLNDTGNYLLLQTDIDFKRQQLTFTLWGQADGRKGWYTHPTVTKWIAPPESGPDIVSDELKPGERKCQNSFRGAVANFVYTRVTSSSQQIDYRFDSYYRPLAKICMVGPSTSTTSGLPNTGSTPISSEINNVVVSSSNASSEPL